MDAPTDSNGSEFGINVHMSDPQNTAVRQIDFNPIKNLVGFIFVRGLGTLKFILKT